MRLPFPHPDLPTRPAPFVPDESCCGISLDRRRQRARRRGALWLRTAGGGAVAGGISVDDDRDQYHRLFRYRAVRHPHRPRWTAPGWDARAAIRHGRVVRRLHHLLRLQPGDLRPPARRADADGRRQRRAVPGVLPDCRVARPPHRPPGYSRTALLWLIVLGFPPSL